MPLQCDRSRGYGFALRKRLELNGSQLCPPGLPGGCRCLVARLHVFTAGRIGSADFFHGGRRCDASVFCLPRAGCHWVRARRDRRPEPRRSGRLPPLRDRCGCVNASARRASSWVTSFNSWFAALPRTRMLSTKSSSFLPTYPASTRVLHACLVRRPTGGVPLVGGHVDQQDTEQQHCRVVAVGTNRIPLCSYRRLIGGGRAQRPGPVSRSDIGRRPRCQRARGDGNWDTRMRCG